MTSNEPNVSPRARYTLAETAKLLGICRRTLYNWEENGRITRTWNKFGGYFLGAAITKAWKGL